MAIDAPSRRFPAIVITGTPGTGKSTHAQLLAEESPIPLKHINVGDLIKEKSLHEGFDEEWQSYTVDEDKASSSCLLDELEPIVSEGGIILDWHTCELFPERWVDLVVVLRCNHTQLWERLEKRGYPLKKIQENNEAEIMDVVIEEARSSYAEEIVVELQSEGTEDLESNVSRIVQWIQAWRKDRGFVDADS
ncbi:hypothetical protein EW146_g6298 [Bondarzewia mesenterica]|uniref:Adenylate kinase isoenzyme 6 homolog n=1 Tax=Bondarzewia mesenterica TaxID=1095465 RepID=A0A4V3XEK4_9AGAM|nr:hypothetical protein EW146_g6298 [Bondarzewia mesenterica]